jgi:hypothetical protein
MAALCACGLVIAGCGNRVIARFTAVLVKRR